MKKIYIIMVLSSICLNAIAQDDYKNFHRYWEYRYRLYETFVKIDWDEAYNPDIANANIGAYQGGIGDDPDVINDPNQDAKNNAKLFGYEKAGYSIPFVTYFENIGNWCYYKFGDDCKYSQHFVEWEVQNSDERPCGILEIGDGTIQLANYIAVLATEYALLSTNSQFNAAQKTADELYLALQAYKRLDKTANQIFSNAYSPTCNNVNDSGLSGFFIRDDIPATFHEEYDDGNGVCIGNVVGGNNHHAIVSTFACGGRENGTLHQWDLEDYNFTSQDQVIALLYGLGLVANFVGPTVTASNGAPILSIAQNIATAIVTNVGENGCNRCITTPCTDHHFPNSLGGDARFTFKGMVQAHNFINPANPINIPTIGDDATLWASFLSSLGNQTNDNQNFFANLGVFFDNAGNINSIENISLEDGKYIYGVTQALFQGFPANPEILDELKYALNSAPCGSGPCTPCKYPGGLNYCPCAYSDQDPEPVQYEDDWCKAQIGSGWLGTYRWTKPEQRNSINDGSNALSGNGRNGGVHSGLDYMLGYNLYHLARLSSVPYFDTNNPENGITFNVPHTGTFPTYHLAQNHCAHEGTLENPELLSGYMISSTADILANEVLCESTDPIADTYDGSVTYKAKQQIDLNIGFKVERGARFYAEIVEDDLACSEDGSYAIPRLGNPVKNTKTTNPVNNRSNQLDKKTPKSGYVDFLAYPNPTNGIINIEFYLSEEQPVSIELINSANIVQDVIKNNSLTSSGNVNITYDGSNLSNGIYYIRIKTNRGTNAQKIILMN